MKLKSLPILCFLLLFNTLSSQVGINTGQPNAVLHVAATTDDQKNGIIIPQLDEFPTTVTADQDSMMVFITGNGTVNKGYWYYDHGSGWKKMVDGESSNSLQAYRNLKFPDGMKGIQPVTQNLSTGGYTVPLGKNLYITSAIGAASQSITVTDGITYATNDLISNTTGNYRFPTFNNPIIIGQSSFLNGGFTFNGFLVDATVQPVHALRSYVVPANKVFVFLNSNNNENNNFPAVVIDGQTVAVVGSNNNRDTSSEPLAMPLFVDEGQTITTNVSGRGSVINGYLIDK